MTVLEKYNNYDMKVSKATFESRYEERNKIINEKHKWEESLSISELEEIVTYLKAKRMSMGIYHVTKRIQNLIDKKKKELELNNKDTLKVVYSK